MFTTTNALVLREVRYKEADRILTLLTSTDGKITVKARGALRKSSKTAAGTQQLTYSEMSLFGNRGKWTVNEAVVKEEFAGLREDIEAFALGSYFAECLEALSVEDQADPELLQLGLNSLFALFRFTFHIVWHLRFRSLPQNTEKIQKSTSPRRTAARGAFCLSRSLRDLFFRFLRHKAVGKRQSADRRKADNIRKGLGDHQGKPAR